MGDVVSLFSVTAQEEIFIQHYLISVNRAEAAYNSGFCDILNEYNSFEQVPSKQIKYLEQAAARCLKKEEVRNRISLLAKEHAEKNGSADLTEIMSYLTSVIRMSKQNEFKNIMLVNAAIKAIETLIKRYPNFENSEKQDAIIFDRGIK